MENKQKDQLVKDTVGCLSAALGLLIGYGNLFLLGFLVKYTYDSFVFETIGYTLPYTVVVALLLLKNILFGGHLNLIIKNVARKLDGKPEVAIPNTYRLGISIAYGLTLLIVFIFNSLL